ncbi:MAG: arginine deiminase family protein [Dongiaceae bacterium]
MDASTYNATIKLFGSEWEPEFESEEKLTRLWGRRWGCDNDVGQLRAVLVHRPGHEFDIIDPTKRIEEIGSYGDPRSGWYWQSKRIPPLAELQAQHDALVAALKAEGAEVIYLEGVEGGRFKSIYTRDSSFAVKGGAIVCRMAPRMRHGEELPVTRILAKIGMPILRTLHGTAMMEGGTFAWLNPTNAVIGRSIRANDEGIEQIAEVLRWQGVTLHVVDLCGYDIHIDGSLCMIDVDLALVNPFGLAFTFLETLKELGIRTIEIGSEDDGWIINCLAVRPGRVLMPDGISDGTRKRLEKAGVEIVPLPYASVQLNGGGIHCSTCPLIRDPV